MFICLFVCFPLLDVAAVVVVVVVVLLLPIIIIIIDFIFSVAMC